MPCVHSLRWMCWTKTALPKLSPCRQAGNAAAAALLADAEHKKYVPQPKKQRYDFDF